MFTRTKVSVFLLSSVMAFLPLAWGCSEDFDDANPYGVGDDIEVTRSALNAYCQIAVTGYGTVDMETDYVPNVTACENGSAGDQAIRAQAVSARTFGYYKISTNGTPVDNGTNHQVYKCSYTKAADRHYAAALDTTGLVLTYKDKITAGFYVAGSKIDRTKYPDCVYTGNSTHADWASTQKYVTYNKGKSGKAADGFSQTTLGWVNDGNYANRGCMSQNGARCLGEIGQNYKQILNFFYGEDIVFNQTTGSCVKQKACETVIDKSGVIIDDLNPCFTRSATNSWFELNTGYAGHAVFTYVWDKPSESIGTWRLNVTRAGKYEIFVHIPADIGLMSQNAPYVVRSGGKETNVNLDLKGKSGWISLGEFDLVRGSDQWVKLSDASGEPYTDTNGKRVVFDAIRLDDSACRDACPSDGAKQCSGKGIQTCHRATPSDCLTWSSVEACQSGYSCSSGSCKLDAQPCTDSCKVSGALECGEGGYRVCGNYNSDPCLEWSDIKACEADKVCRDGVCQAEDCENLCAEGATTCAGSGYKTCGDFDSDGCMEWSSVESCATGLVCDAGVCLPASDIWDGSRPGDVPKMCLTEIDGQYAVDIDNLNPCFSRTYSTRWSELSGYGYEGHLYYAYVTDGMPSAVGIWHLNIVKAGKYSLYAYVDADVGQVSKRAPYTVFAAGRTMSRGINISGKTGWYKIGDYDFVESNNQYVLLMDATGEDSGDGGGKRLVYDAIKIAPYGTEVDFVLIADEKPDPNNPPDKDDPSIDENKPGVHSSSSCSAAPFKMHMPWYFLSIPLLMLGFVAFRRSTAELLKSPKKR